MAVLLRKMAQAQYTVPAAKGSQGGYTPALSRAGARDPASCQLLPSLAASAPAG